MPKISKACKQGFKNGVLQTGKQGGLYVNKRSAKTGKGYRVYCTKAFKKSGSSKVVIRSLSRR